ncbi:DNA-3-methyladenine glycosylase I [Alloscardovia sp. HMSC034E08]|uniref:DNA-3-methyladenine glycosylase I n=1 Tax=Alloscardovia sp. HMSC034E08 TaxID=1739413 RepID=UPI001AEF97B1
MRSEFGSFTNYLWAYTDNKNVVYKGHGDGAIPVSNYLSDKVSKDLKRRGFKYVSSITIYSHLQA